MRIITNQRKAKRKRLIATSASISGVLMLISSLLLPFLIRNIPGPPLILIALGLAFSLTGIRMANQWVRPPLPHDALNAGLRGLGRQATIYHYHLPAPHVLVCQHGIFTLTIVPHPISASVNQDRWHRDENILRRLFTFFRQDTLGNPTIEATIEATRMQKWLDKHIPDHNITVQPAIIFTNPGAFVQVGKTITTPVLYADKRKPSLKQWIREQQHPTLSEGQRTQLETAAKIT